MPALAYPATLPAPAPGLGLQPLERRAIAAEGNPLARARALDFGGTYSAVWTYTPTQMAVWIDWFENTLKRTLWFACPLHGAGGFITRVVRYVGVTKTFLGAGVWRVQAELELRGASVAPVAALPAAAAWSAIDKGAAVALSAGNRTATTNTATFSNVAANRVVSSGKWYAEVLVNAIGDDSDWYAGWGESPVVVAAQSRETAVYRSGVVVRGRGTVFSYGSGLGAFLGVLVPADTVMMALNFANGYVWFGKNGTWASGPPPSTGDSNQVAISGLLVAQPCSVVFGPDNAGSTASATLRAAPFYPVPDGFALL